VEAVPRGAVLAPARGRVLWDAPRRSPPAAVAAASPGAWRTLAFLVLLPLFGETFQYIVDVDPLYRLAKGWPLLTLPLAAWGLARLDLPYKAQLLLVCGWALGVTPLLGVLQLGNLIGGAVASTVKVWALTYGFSAAAALVLLRPDPRRLGAVVIALGLITFVAMVVISAAAPPEAYLRTIEQTKIFLQDPERGNRVNVPMFLGLLSMFTIARSFWARPRWWQPVVLAVCFLLMLTIYKQRVPFIGAVTIIVLGGVLNNPRWRIPRLVSLIAAAVVAVPAYLYLHAETVAAGLGGSLTMRQMEFGHAVDFLNAEPWRWITGVGSATRIGDVTLADIIGARVFFLADLGWLGVAFEYGAIGVALLAALHWAGLRLTWRAIRRDDPLSGALFDYVLYIVLASPITSVVLSPGEVLTCMALAWYLMRCRGAWAQPGLDQKTLGPTR
jgi:hypothetical protein